MIRQLRRALGWSQDRLAAELRSRHPTVTREMVSRWEHGKRTPGPFWLHHLAAALQVPCRELEAHVRRREMLQAAMAAAAGALAAGTVGGATAKAAAATCTDLYSSIACGDDGPLATVQTAHQTDMMLAGMISSDRPVLMRLARWADDGGSDVLRVNAAGILAKTRLAEPSDLAVAVLRRDADVRHRYLWAVSRRVGADTERLITELANKSDAGARWCSAWLLSQRPRPAGRRAIARALRGEPVTENVRTFGMLLNGDDPCW